MNRLCESCAAKPWAQAFPSNAGCAHYVERLEARVVDLENVVRQAIEWFEREEGGSILWQDAADYLKKWGLNHV